MAFKVSCPSLQGIYDNIMARFPYYKNMEWLGWQNSIRHNLSRTKGKILFVKEERPDEDCQGRGSYWRLNPNNIIKRLSEPSEHTGTESKVLTLETGSGTADAATAVGAPDHDQNKLIGEKGHESPIQRLKHHRPPFSYSALVSMAIQDSPEQRLTLQGIYDNIMAKFPYYKNMEWQAAKGWQNSIRHNLSLGSSSTKGKVLFVKEENTEVRGCYWRLDPSNTTKVNKNQC